MTAAAGSLYRAESYLQQLCTVCSVSKLGCCDNGCARVIATLALAVPGSDMCHVDAASDRKGYAVTPLGVRATATRFLTPVCLRVRVCHLLSLTSAWSTTGLDDLAVSLRLTFPVLGFIHSSGRTPSDGGAWRATFGFHTSLLIYRSQNDKVVSWCRRYLLLHQSLQLFKQSQMFFPLGRSDGGRCRTAETGQMRRPYSHMTLQKLSNLLLVTRPR